MIDFLNSKGFGVTIKPGRIYLDRHGQTYDYPTIRAAYLAHGGPARDIYASNGRTSV